MTSKFNKLLLHIFIIITPLFSQQPQIYMDGNFTDWQSLSPLFIDPYGDQIGGTIDFGKLWITHDAQFLFIRIEVGGEINIQDLNEITLFMDTDNNPSTGIPVKGIGAELQWNFGNRNGIFRVGASGYAISHSQIGLVTAPTVTSTEFEISLRRDATPIGQNPLFPSNTIRIVFRDNGPGQDELPDGSGGVSYSFNSQNPPPLNSISIRKPAVNSVRIMSYNVLFDGFFDPQKEPAFTRILQALQPEIIGFEEIYDHDALETANQVESILPSTGQQQWYNAKAGPDVIAVSRYPIENHYQIDGNGAFVINLNPAFNSKLLFIVAHLPCCGNNFERQMEIDAIMAFIRDAKSPGGTITLPANTPIIVEGDLNLVGDAQQLITLLTGQIINTGTYGPPFPPDWDNSDFSDLLPRQTNRPQFFTWYDVNSSFSPGRLDFMIYSDSAIEAVKKFTLFTPQMNPDTLNVYNLQPNDVVTASDHLPVVADFRLLPTTGLGSTQPSSLQGFSLSQNYPNPFNPTTTIEYHIPERSKVKIDIFNSIGQTVKKLTDGEKGVGVHQVTWDGKNREGREVSNGIYLLRMTANSPHNHFVDFRKMLLLR